MLDLLKIVIDGGWMMAPLLALSVVALVIVFERGYAFWRNSTIDARGLRSRVFALIRKQEVDDAALLCASTPHPVSAVLLAGLQAYRRHRAYAASVRDLTEEISEAMQFQSEHAISVAEKRLYLLPTVATAAPLLGMLGTVMGMIMLFDELGVAEGNADPGELAKGISVALITTGAGLFIALCAALPYNWFNSLIDRIDLEIEESSTELLDLVATQLEGSKQRGDFVGHRPPTVGRGGNRRASLRPKTNGRAVARQ